jgi:hypothetical protein
MDENEYEEMDLKILFESRHQKNTLLPFNNLKLL